MYNCVIACLLTAGCGDDDQDINSKNQSSLILFCQYSQYLEKGSSLLECLNKLLSPPEIGMLVIKDFHFQVTIYKYLRFLKCESVIMCYQFNMEMAVVD